MLPPTCLPLQACTATTPQPCAFKQMWFSDIPFSVPTESADNSLAVTIRSASSMYQFLRRQVLDMLLTKLHVNLLLRVHNINLGLFKFVHQSKVDLLISIEMRTSNELMLRASNHTAPPSLQTLPAEIRFKIFEHLTEGTSMRVVGYRHGGRDAFWFKDRGYLPIIVTCKQFYGEMMDVYFRNVRLNIKSATPSSFSGDMSAFGTDTFRQRIRKVQISDDNKERRARISSAFKNAKIEHTGRSASGSRKGAYYFNA